MPGSIMFELGDSRWCHDDETKAAVLATPPKRQQPLKIVRQSPPAKTAGRAVSPSQIAAGSRLRGSELFSLKRQKSMEYGTLIHAWLEAITWLDNGPPDENEMQAIAIRQGWQWATAEAKLPHFRRLLAEPKIKGLLNYRDYETDVRDWLRGWQADLGTLRFEVHNEQSIAWEDAGQFGTGSIDRLVLIYGDDRLLAADIIDYKTDPTPDHEAVRLKSRHYAPQLDAYRKAAAHMFRLPEDRLRCRLAFLNSNVVSEAIR